MSNLYDFIYEVRQKIWLFLNCCLRQLHHIKLDVLLPNLITWITSILLVKHDVMFLIINQWDYVKHSACFKF